MQKNIQSAFTVKTSPATVSLMKRLNIILNSEVFLKEGLLLIELFKSININLPQMRLREYIDYIMHRYVLEYCNIKEKRVGMYFLVCKRT